MGLFRRLVCRHNYITAAVSKIQLPNTNTWVITQVRVCKKCRYSYRRGGRKNSEPGANTHLVAWGIPAEHIIELSHRDSDWMWLDEKEGRYVDGEGIDVYP